MNKKRFIKIGSAVICIFIFGILLFIINNSYSMNRMIENEVEELISVAKNTGAMTYSLKDIENLPPLFNDISDMFLKMVRNISGLSE